jgi:AcrR family transcriptional regulator
MARPGTASRVKGGAETGAAGARAALLRAAVETLKADGYGGASARAIAARAGCNPGLVFYYFGSVADLLLAALDTVSAERLERYGAAIADATSATELATAAATVFREDLAEGYITVLVEMIAGASSTPGLGAEIAARVAPWRDLAQRAVETASAGSPLASLVPPAEIAHGIVALYLGLELLAHLDGDPSSASGLLARATQLAPFVDAMRTTP